MESTANQLGKYTLCEQIGEGKFGWVFKATDNLNRKLAIKVLKPGWADDALALERFRREALVTSQLFHSRIATIIDFDESAGRRFIVMRYVDGITLDKLIKQKGHLGWLEALDILSQVADGLDYAHKRGFIHLDISLINIMISNSEGAVLTDFGLARVATMNTISSSGVVLGTPYYIAPEVWSGKTVTPATDVYSLACVAYEMLTGKVLFSGENTPEIMTHHMLYAPQFPDQLAEDVPPGIIRILTHALEKDPALRYQDVMSFILDLKNLLPVGLPATVTAQVQPAQTASNSPSAEPTQPDLETHPTHHQPAPPAAQTTQSPKAVVPLEKKHINAGFIFRLWPFGLGVLTVFLFGILLGGPANQAFASTVFFKAAMTQQATVHKLFSTSIAPEPVPTQMIESSPNTGLGMGARQTREADGMEMVFVPAGPFLMGTDLQLALSSCKNDNLECQPNWFADEEPLHTVQLESFWIDQTEVTNREYGVCVKAGVCSPPLNSASVTRTDYYGNPAFSNYPVINVDWNMADAYCSWAGARLPTEKEWEKAARGPDGHLYPWGDSYTPNQANIATADTVPVGSYQAKNSPYGSFDMAGNVWEWTSDGYDVYPGGNSNASTNFGSNSRVVRGGSWSGSFNDSRSANRDHAEISSYFSDLGFRCALSNGK